MSEAAPTVERQGADSANDSQQGPGNFSVPVRIIENPSDAEHTKDREQKSDQHDAADLKAQELAASAAQRSAISGEGQEVAARWQLWIAGIGTALLLLSLKYTRDALKLTREIGRDQSRAYVQAKKAHAAWCGGILPVITVTVDNRGQTPAKWFGYRCVVASSELPSRPFNRESVQKAKKTCWYGLGPNDKRTFRIAQEILSPFANQSGPRKTILRIDGLIEYETFFGELYISEFSFHGDVDPRNGIVHEFGKASEMKPIKLSHSAQELRSYFYVGDATKGENEPA